MPSEKHVMGQRVWVKVASYCDWPGIIWSIDMCFKKIIPELVNSYSPGQKLNFDKQMLSWFRECFGEILWGSKQYVLQEIEH